MCFSFLGKPGKEFMGFLKVDVTKLDQFSRVYKISIRNLKIDIAVSSKGYFIHFGTNPVKFIFIKKPRGEVPKVLRSTSYKISFEKNLITLGYTRKPAIYKGGLNGVPTRHSGSGTELVRR